MVSRSLRLNLDGLRNTSTLPYATTAPLQHLRSFVSSIPITIRDSEDAVRRLRAPRRGGALKLKGSKVEKKKKKKKPKSDLEKNLAVAEIDESKKAAKSPEAAAAEGEQPEERQAPQKTEAEKRHEEIRRKRVRDDSSRGT